MINPAPITIPVPRLLMETPSAPAKKSKFDFIIELFKRLFGMSKNHESSTCVLSKLKAKNAANRDKHPEKYKKVIKNGKTYHIPKLLP